MQDAAAALPARLLGNLNQKKVIDLCAAPGGKTAQLIAAGGEVTAIDISGKRIEVLKRNLKRLKMNANLVVADGRKFVPKMPVDAVLLDAPCSSTGTIRRRPDILRRSPQSDLINLQNTQRDLLHCALKWLKPGGRLVYATCSLQPQEGEDILKSVLSEAGNKYKIVPINDKDAGLFAKSINRNGYLRILPSNYTDIGGVDGFFVARLTSVT